jgi:hypothetical protein
VTGNTVETNGHVGLQMTLPERKRPLSISG